ncbi:MAG: hypothetical protein LBT40_02085, partial [Deltaproteobacteria bacterium]|nr:hypothetical protein [Deltaproteobacteria bacterium]
MTWPSLFNLAFTGELLPPAAWPSLINQAFTGELAPAWPSLFNLAFMGELAPAWPSLFNLTFTESWLPPTRWPERGARTRLVPADGVTVTARFLTMGAFILGQARHRQRMYEASSEPPVSRSRLPSAYALESRQPPLPLP